MSDEYNAVLANIDNFRMVNNALYDLRQDVKSIRESIGNIRNVRKEDRELLESVQADVKAQGSASKDHVTQVESALSNMTDKLDKHVEEVNSKLDKHVEEVNSKLDEQSSLMQRIADDLAARIADDLAAMRSD